MKRPPKGFNPKTLRLIRSIINSGDIQGCCDDPSCPYCFGSGIYDPRQHPTCIACGDTGVNSKGEACHPCIVNKGKK